MGHTIEVHLKSYTRFKHNATADLVAAVNIWLINQTSLDSGVFFTGQFTDQWWSRCKHKPDNKKSACNKKFIHYIFWLGSLLTTIASEVNPTVITIRDCTWSFILMKPTASIRPDKAKRTDRNQGSLTCIGKWVLAMGLFYLPHFRLRAMSQGLRFDEIKDLKNRKLKA